jgi:hypothetical protein
MDFNLVFEAIHAEYHGCCVSSYLLLRFVSVRERLDLVLKITIQYCLGLSQSHLLTAGSLPILRYSPSCALHHSPAHFPGASPVAGLRLQQACLAIPSSTLLNDRHHSPISVFTTDLLG